MMAVRTVCSFKDIAIATSLTQFFQHLGASISLIIMQTILLNKLLPQFENIAPSFSSNTILQAGETGVKMLVPEQLGEVVSAYANSLDASFIFGVVLTGCALLTAFGVEWKSIRAVKSDVDETDA